MVTSVIRNKLGKEERRVFVLTLYVRSASRMWSIVTQLATHWILIISNKRMEAHVTSCLVCRGGGRGRVRLGLLCTDQHFRDLDPGP